MENQGQQSKLRTLIKEAPPWISIVISIGGMVFALGVMFNNVSGMKARMDKMDDANIQLIRMAGQINLLETQINNSVETQKSTNASVNKLSDATNQLGVSVGQLQGRIEALPKMPPKKHR